MAQPNIKKFIQNQPKRQQVLKNGNKSAHKGSLIDSPMFAVAQGFIENMSWKYKLLIGGAVYLLLSGVAGNIIGIIKLINIAIQ